MTGKGGWVDGRDGYSSSLIIDRFLELRLLPCLLCVQPDPRDGMHGNTFCLWACYEIKVLAGWLRIKRYTR
jgi:hypothetical protein